MATRFSIGFNSVELVDWLEDELKSHKAQLDEREKKLLISSDIDGKKFLALTIALSSFGFKTGVAIACIISSLTKCYQVKAIYIGAMKTKGIRAAVYREAERHLAYYSPAISRSIWYDEDDLKISLFFESEEEAHRFSTFLSQWHFENPYVVKLNDICVERKMNVEYFKSDDLERVRFSDCDPMDSELPVQSLGDFVQSPSSTCSHSTAEGVPSNDPSAKYQSIEKESPLSDLLLYKCHIKSKSKFKELKDNENNVLMASWEFHQYFDGLHLKSGHPLLAIRHVLTDSHSTQMEDFPGELRTRVDIAIECFSDDIAEEVGGLLKTGSTRESDTVWKTFVYVKDPEMFRSCLEWKYQETKRIWDENENF